MNIKLIDAVSLHNIISQLNISSLANDTEKLSIIRLTIALKRYAQQWQDTVDTAQSMDPTAANTLVNKEAVTEVTLDDSLLLPADSAEKLAIANAEKLPAGALATIIDLIAKP